MLEIIAVSLICGTFYGDPDLDSAFIDHITVYVNKSDAYDLAIISAAALDTSYGYKGLKS